MPPTDSPTREAGQSRNGPPSTSNSTSKATPWPPKIGSLFTPPPPASEPLSPLSSTPSQPDPNPLDDVSQPESPRYDEPEQESPKAPSTPVSLSDQRALRGTFRSAVGVVGAQLNRWAVRDPLEQVNGVWLTDEPDREGIGDPLANIVGRRGGLGAAANPDVADAITGLIAFVSYVLKHLQLRTEIRRAAQDGRIDPNTGAMRPPEEVPTA